MSRPTLDPARRLGISDTGLSPSPARLPSLFSYLTPVVSQSEPHDARTMDWAPSISLAATLEIDVFFLFLRVLRCFSSPGSPHAAIYSLHADRGFLCRVSPFRYLRIIGYVLLPEAFRSLSRLSSALSAKASTLRPYYFNRSRNDRITRSSVSSLMYSVTSAGFVFFLSLSRF